MVLLENVGSGESPDKRPKDDALPLRPPSFAPLPPEAPSPTVPAAAYEVLENTVVG